MRGGPGCKVSQGKEWERRRRWRGMGDWRRQKLDRLGSLKMQRESKRRGSCRPEQPRPRQPSSPKGAVPLETPGLAFLAARLRAGAEELTYFGAEAALGRAQGGERGGEREHREQQTAGGRWGGRHGPRPSGQSGCAGSLSGPKPWDLAPPLPRAPLSSEGTEFGFLECCPLGDE